jgi:hypothetical protein
MEEMVGQVVRHILDSQLVQEIHQAQTLRKETTVASGIQPARVVGEGVEQAPLGELLPQAVQALLAGLELRHQLLVQA